MVDDVNLKMKKGEFISLIGHSGCGKSTVLSMVAGLNEITGGGIILDVDLPRPRTRKQLLEHPDYYHLREGLLTFLEECDHNNHQDEPDNKTHDPDTGVTAQRETTSDDSFEPDTIDAIEQAEQRLSA